MKDLTLDDDAGFLFPGPATASLSLALNLALARVNMVSSIPGPPPVWPPVWSDEESGFSTVPPLQWTHFFRRLPLQLAPDEPGLVPAGSTGSFFPDMSIESGLFFLTTETGETLFFRGIVGRKKRKLRNFPKKLTL